MKKQKCIILFFTAIITFCPGLGAAEEIGDTRAALEKWVETQRIISQEKKELALAKEMLNERIDLVNREITTLQDKIKQAEDSIAEADKKREEMIEENEKLKEASAALGEVIVKLEDRTKSLLRKLPDPIKEKIKPLSQRLPEEGKESKLSVAERFQNVVGMLNEIDKFNRDITVTSELRTMPDGSSVEVAALYAGIGQGFYASSNGTAAGTGTVGENEWVWMPDDGAAAQIQDAIKIMKNEKVATFVQVPVEIK